MAGDTGQAVEPTGGDEEGSADTAGSKAGGTDPEPGSAAEGARLPTSKSPNTSRFTLGRLKKRGAKFWAGGASAVIITVFGSWLTVWFVFLAGPPASTVTSPSPTIINPGHLPGRHDVSKMTSDQRFYAIPNFYEFPSCGRPCWLPLYESPTEQSAPVTNNWPCEYYGPNVSNEPSCVQPPSRRTSAEMADPADKKSGDKLFVVCQLTQIRKGAATPTVHNEVGKSSDIWDMIAVPGSEVSSNSPAFGRLHQVPGMPGFYEAFTPDLWLGNTGWHNIPCS
jgi:hypothetical protein